MIIDIVGEIKLLNIYFLRDPNDGSIQAYAGEDVDYWKSLGIKFCNAVTPSQRVTNNLSVVGNTKTLYSLTGEEIKFIISVGVVTGSYLFNGRFVGNVFSDFMWHNMVVNNDCAYALQVKCYAMNGNPICSMDKLPFIKSQDESGAKFSICIPSVFAKYLLSAHKNGKAGEIKYAISTEVLIALVGCNFEEFKSKYGVVLNLHKKDLFEVELL